MLNYHFFHPIMHNNNNNTSAVFILDSYTNLREKYSIQKKKLMIKLCDGCDTLDNIINNMIIFIYRVTWKKNIQISLSLFSNIFLI